MFPFDLAGINPVNRLVEPQTPFWRHILLVALFVSSLWFSWNAHLAANYWFPVPWPDEACWGWQSIAMAEGRGLFTPQLNSERVIWWMPPGFFVVMGGIYRIFGFTFEHMRWTSWVFITLWGTILFIWTGRKYKRFEISLLVLCFSLNSFCVVAGNMGRMEALLLLTTLSGYWMMDEQKLGVGLALLIVSPLVHPAGVVYAALGLLAFYVNHLKGFRFHNFRWWDWIALILAAGAWIAYILAFVPHLADYVADMGYQFAAHHKMLTGGPARSSAVDPIWLFLRSLLLKRHNMHVAAYIVLGACLLPKYNKKEIKTDVYLWGFGLSGVLVRMAGAEMWYEAYAAAGILIWFILFLNKVALYIDLTKWPAALRRVARTTAFLGVVAILFQANFLPNPFGYPKGLKWWAWDLKPRGVYLTQEDVASVAEELDRVIHGLNAVTRIRHIPAADGLIFYQYQPKLGIAHFPVFSKRVAQYELVHLYPEPWVSDLSELPVGIESWPNARKLFQRDGHSWYLVEKAAAKEPHDAK